MASSFSAQVPSGKSISVKIIDSTSKITGLPAEFLMTPSLYGFDKMPDLPTWSFLIEHDSGRKLLFDLGVPTDWEEMTPVVSERLKSSGWGISVEKPTVTLLKEHGIEPQAIEGIVWSHWHWDHIGNPSTFPKSTKVIVGPGFKNEFLPAYPTNEKAYVREIDFDGRELQEVTFTEEQSVKIGPFRGYDYFEDGSFFLLDTPGHAVGHLAGLARTSILPDTFIFMGGDLTHHAGELRPSQHMPLPSSIPATHLPDLSASLAYSTACPGAIFEDLQNTRNRKPTRTTPFFEPSMGKDIPLAIETIKRTQTADADDNVLYIFAHDNKIRGIVNLFPAVANDWKKSGWRERLLWRFLEDFESAAKLAKERLESGREGGKL